MRYQRFTSSVENGPAPYLLARIADSYSNWLQLFALLELCQSYGR